MRKVSCRDAMPRPATEQTRPRPLPKRMEIYGYNWNPAYSRLEIELICFHDNRSPNEGGLGRAGHCKQIIQMLWGEENKLAHFVMTPWAEDMIDALCNHQGPNIPNYVAITGCASSGKSETMAVFGLVSYLTNPLNTCVLISSTSIGAAKKRVWGSVVKYWNALPEGAKLGKLIESSCMIRFHDPNGMFPDNEKMGVHLVACEPKKEKTAIAKLIGFKATQMIVLGDEFCELSPAILEAAMSNLSVNERFTLVAAGNFRSIYDPLGIVAEPEDGWGSINPDMGGWKSRLGTCLHFDGEKSPNVTAGKVVYKFLPTARWIEEQKEALGPNSIAYWRMVKGFPAPEGAEDGLYSESDFITFAAGDDRVFWKGKPTPVAGLDIGFTQGGDGSYVQFGLFGPTEEGFDVLLYTDHVLLTEDRRVRKTRSRQIAEAFRDECAKRGVLPNCAGYDSTGTGGKAMGDAIAEIWSPQCLGVEFGGAPSAIPVGVQGRDPAHKRFYNRVSELWGVGVDFVRSLQIKGVKGDLGKQLAARRIKGHMKRGDDLLMQVEEKKEMRKRTNGESPDLADAGMIALDVCRARFRFRANVARSVNDTQKKLWKDFVQKQDVTNSGMSLDTGAVKKPWHQRIKQVEVTGWGGMKMLR